MELQISYRVCAKIPEKGILQREMTGSGKDPERAVRVEKDKNSRGRSVPGPCAYALGDTAEILRFKFVGFLKGKSSLALYERFPELKYKYRNREFWCRGYYVDTAGKNTKRIAEYIKHQLDEDQMAEQMTMGNI